MTLPRLLMTPIAVLALALGACESSNRSVKSFSESDQPTVSIRASATQIVVGEIVTFAARTQDTYGRDAQLRWSSTAGELKIEQDGRVARGFFNETGTYTVKAVLSVDGREVGSDMAEVRVLPVP